MKITFYNRMPLLKFLASRDLRVGKDNIAIDNRAIEASMPDIQEIYGRASVNMQSNTTLFERAVFDLSSSLAGLSDDEFNNLDIKQAYEKDDFITKVFSLTDELSENERLEVFSYFGFELYQNEENSTGYSILGYPHKFSDDTLFMENKNQKTGEIINKLQAEVIKFLDNNPVISNNIGVARELNKIVNVFPELRVLIGKKQHKNHCFDVMKHSLKVMQKIAQNPEFESLNDSDKKLLLIASLFHDIRKTEGKRDPEHALKGAIDTECIMKKLKLTKNEENKLYSLIKNHGWLNYVNRTLTQKEEQEAQKTAAFDMRQGNLFDMMKIFTEADLKSTKNSDVSYYKHKEEFEAHSSAISKCINELQI